MAGNQLRYKFEDSPVLGDSISMYETKQNIVLLVATISSVHKIKFPRPKVSKINKWSFYLYLHMFFDVFL